MAKDEIRPIQPNDQNHILSLYSLLNQHALTMARKANNTLLQKAKKSKSDEFYTQLSDIESELKHYKNHFKGNFFNYFSANFKPLGIKKLISASYRKQAIDLLNNKKAESGFYAEYEGERGEAKKEEVDIIHFNGDGDFRSKESIELLKQADIVVTNPPFSLIREYVAQLIKYDKNF